MQSDSWADPDEGRYLPGGHLFKGGEKESSSKEERRRERSMVRERRVRYLGNAATHAEQASDNVTASGLR